MSKLYERGDVIFLKCMLLCNRNGTKEMDLRLNGHPFVIMEDVYELGETVPCLKISSGKKGKRKEEQYVIENFKIVGRPAKKSYVDIKNVYNVNVDKSYLVQGRIKKPVMEELEKLANIS